MFNLFRKLRGESIPRVYHVPKEWRVYAVGDIHGRADLLRLLHQEIARDAEEAGESRKNLIVYLGDYLDRGPYVKETLDELICNRPNGFHARYLQGNHEQLFLAFLNDPSRLKLWAGLGGQATLLSYRVLVSEAGFSRDQEENIHQAILEAMPETHLNFLKNLDPFFKIGDYLFVHAGIRPGIPMAKQIPEDLFWIRDDFSESMVAGDLKIIHGHTIHVQVQERHNRIGIDTGAYATGILTSVVLEEDRVRFLSTAVDECRD